MRRLISHSCFIRAIQSVYGSSSIDSDFKMPAPRPRKKQLKRVSPGAVIDNANADDEHFLDTVVSAFFSDYPIAVPEDSSYFPKALGRFAKNAFVHAHGQIDGRFRAHPTHVGQQLSWDLADKNGKHVILLGKSGIGKTTAIFDASKTRCCVFFSASHYKMDMQKRDPGQFDKSFSTMVKALTENVDDAERCNHIIKAMVLSWFLVMCKFQELQGATPEKWMQCQLTKGMHGATLAAFSLLRNYEQKDKVKILGEKVQKEFEDNVCPWFFAYDECQHGHEILKGRCNVWKSTETNEARGVSCPFLRVIGDIGTVVIAGTALSIATADSCLSDFGRPTATTLHTDFPAVDLEQIYSELNATLNLTDVDLDKIPLWKLEGRGRLLGGLPLREKLKDSLRQTKRHC